MVEAENRRAGRRQNERGEGPAQNEKGREEAHQSGSRDLTRPLRRERERMRRRRSPSPPMIAVRSDSLMAAQAAISATERPQPMQSVESGSTTQIWTQGVAIAAREGCVGMGVI